MNDNNALFQFKRESHNGDIFYILLPIERLNHALKVLNLGFYPHETIAMCCQVAKNPKAVDELNELCKECIKDGVSLVAVEKSSNQIVGVSINKIQHKITTEEQSFFEKFVKNSCKEDESISLIKSMIQCDSYVDPFEYYNTNKVMEIMFLAVLPSHAKRGIGLELTKSDLHLVNELSVNFHGLGVATALFTSPFSQKIGEDLLFENLDTIPLNQFEYKNRKYSKIVGIPHPGIKVMAKEIHK